MSWDVTLVNAVDKKPIEIDYNHYIRGGTYCAEGTNELTLNITYNYSPIFYKVIDKEKGLRWLNNKTALETLPVLESACAQLNNDTNEDYWKPTEGNAKQALISLITFAKMRPDAIWQVD